MNTLLHICCAPCANQPIEVAPGITAKESVAVTKSTWAGDESIYIPYPNNEVEKNPNLRR